MGAAVHNRAVSSKHLDISNKDQLFAADEQRDIALCGRSLAEPGTTRFAKQGAHDPTPTPYFILEDLFPTWSSSTIRTFSTSVAAQGASCRFSFSRTFPEKPRA